MKDTTTRNIGSTEEPSWSKDTRASGSTDMWCSPRRIHLYRVCKASLASRVIDIFTSVPLFLVKGKLMLDTRVSVWGVKRRETLAIIGHAGEYRIKSSPPSEVPRVLPASPQSRIQKELTRVEKRPCAPSPPLLLPCFLLRLPSRSSTSSCILNVSMPE